jgi:hypothetical protein
VERRRVSIISAVISTTSAVFDTCLAYRSQAHATKLVANYDCTVVSR